MSSKRGTSFHKRTDFKVTLWYVFTFMVTTSLILSFTYFRVKHNLLKEIDRFLLDEAKELSAKILGSSGNVTAAIVAYEKSVFMREHYPMYSRVLNGDGKVVAASKNFAEIVYPVNQEKLRLMGPGSHHVETVHSPGRRTPFRVLSSRLLGHENSGYIIQVGTRMRGLRKTLSNFRHNLFTALPIALVLGGIGGWFLARRSLSPIARITETARRITASNLAERIEPRGSGDELDHLIATLNEMISRLESSFKRISQFTADASHEMRTPISSMKGEAELLLSKPRSPGEYRRVLVNHIEKLDFLTRLVNDLILLSKFDSNEAGLDMASIELSGLLVNLWELFGALADRKGVAFTLGKIEQTNVLGDRTRLQQLFTNLIDNAIKFTPPGGRVDISLERDGRFARVSLKDTGIGIPEGEFEHIFQRFYRVDKSRSRDRGGTGLGLSICEWIVKAHHGSIKVESQVGEGSRFLVSLPLQSGR